VDRPQQISWPLPLEGRYPCAFLDAELESAAGGRVVDTTLVIARGVHETGRRR